MEHACGRENDEADLDVAKDGEIVGFLQQSATALREADLAAGLVLDPSKLHLDSPPPHSRALRNLQKTPSFFGFRGGFKSSDLLSSVGIDDSLCLCLVTQSVCFFFFFCNITQI